MMHAGIGEVTGAVMLAASFAVASSILYMVFHERMETAEGEAAVYTEAALLRAAELVAAGPAECGNGFLLHNYSPYPLELADAAVYTAGGGRIHQANASYLDMDGSPLHILEGGRSAWVRTEAPCPLVMVTPGGGHLRIGE